MALMCGATRFARLLWSAVRRTRTKSPLAVAVSIVLLGSCRFDSQVPWDTTRIMDDLVSELRRFEGLASDFDRYEVLAWRVNRRDGRDPVEIVLVWARTAPDHASTRWALVQAYRHPDEADTWRRSLFHRCLRFPMTHTRPGESLDGTWHAFHMYEHAPTTLEICDFAIVDFFRPDYELGGYKRVSGGVQRRTWRRVAGAEPACGFAT